MWHEIKSEITKKNILKVFIWLVGTIIVIQLTIYFDNINESKGRSELSVIDKQYEIRWRPLIDPNTSELISNDRYEVIVLTNVTNNKESNYKAEITNAEYFILNPNMKTVGYWRSNQEYISMLPGTTFLKGDSHKIILSSGNYTLMSIIYYQDDKGIRTPLKLSAKIFISYNQSKIEDIAPERKY